MARFKEGDRVVYGGTVRGVVAPRPNGVLGGVLIRITRPRHRKGELLAVPEWSALLRLRPRPSKLGLLAVAFALLAVVSAVMDVVTS